MNKRHLRGALAIVWLVAFAVRALYLWQISRAPFLDLRIGDAAAYDAWARRIAAGDWIGRDIFYQAPLYPYLLAIVYRVIDHSGDSVIVVRAIQALLGATSCALVAAAGMRLTGSIGGAAAGLLLAVYPPAIFLDGLLEKSALVTFLTTALIALVATQPANVARWIATGAVLGLLALTRENALLLAVPIVLWIVVHGPAEAGQYVRVGAFLGGCAIVLLPVALRNAALGREFALTTSQFGPNFYIGNHEGASGTYEPLAVGHGSAADEQADATRLAETALGRRLSPQEVSAYWTKRAVDDIRAQPLEWMKLIVRKIALTFNATEIPDTESQEVYADSSRLLRILRPFDFGVLLALAAFGAMVSARDWRRFALLYLIGATYALSVVLFYVFARYRFPIAPVLTIGAAAGFVEAAPLVRSARASGTDTTGDRRAGIAALTAGVLAAAAVALFSRLPIEDTRSYRPTHYFAIAAAASNDPGRFDQAAELYARALDAAPAFPAAHFGLATLLTKMGRHADALPHYREAVASWPDHAEARYNFGLALAAAGDAEGAAAQFREALRIRPDDVDAHLALAKTLLALNRPELALEECGRALAQRPDSVRAMVTSGVALTGLGRVPEALERYQRALRLNPDDPDAHNNLGWTLATQGRIAEAVPHFERALALRPGDVSAAQNLEQARRLAGAAR